MSDLEAVDDIYRPEREGPAVLTDIPFDCIHTICQFFNDFHSLCRLSQTCWWLNGLVQEDDLWEPHCKTNIPPAVYNRVRHRLDVGLPDAGFISWQRFLKRYFVEKKTSTLVGVISNAMASNQPLTGSQCDAIRNFAFLDLAQIGTCIGSGGVEKISTLIAGSSRLQVLDLSGQLLRDSGAASLAEGIRYCSSLQSITLVDNRIKDAGATKLAHAFQVMPCLEKIDLSSNHITSVGATELATAIAASDSIVDVFMNDNPLRDEGVKALLMGGKPASPSTDGIVGRLQRGRLVRSRPFHSLSLRDVGLSKGPEKALELTAFVKQWDEYSKCAPGTIMGRISKGEMLLQKAKQRQAKSQPKTTLHLDFRNLDSKGDSSKAKSNPLKNICGPSKVINPVYASDTHRLLVYFPSGAGEGKTEEEGGCACC